jgi:Na+-driven multidrug efflux pump
MLGAQKSKEEVMDYNYKVTTFAVMAGIGCALVTIGCSGLFPMMFNTTDEVRRLATGLIIISSVAMPLQAYIFPVYFVLRAGGKTIITFLFDSGAIWILMLPIAFVLSRFTALSILLIYALCNAMDFFKCLLGFYFIKRGDWVQNLTNK